MSKNSDKLHSSFNLSESKKYVKMVTLDLQICFSRCLYSEIELEFNKMLTSGAWKKCILLNDMCRII